MRIIYRLYIAILLLVAQTVRAQHTFTVMEYNCENAFDTIHDEGKNDIEYCPEGDKRWSNSKLYKKLTGISKVIAAGWEHQPVDLVALCEVENDNVMTMLTKHSILANLGYEYIMTNSADSRGIDVALLYSPSSFHPVDAEHIRPILTTHPSRDILHVAGTIFSGDTLDVYVVHLPSKLGGMAAQLRSMKVVELLEENINSITRKRKHPNVIVMGDFNAEPKSQQMRSILKNTSLKDATADLSPGTYKYKGDWSIIDHILYRTPTFSSPKAEVLTLPFLLEQDKTYGGNKPYRTYLGPTYKGGTSDHLPIIGVFTFKK